jgi:hypothetical protein
MIAVWISVEMAHHVLVVEGAHDAAFFGRLLASRGFATAANLTEVPEFWTDAIPTKYPVRRDLTLERVINFPEIHQRPDGEDTFGVVVANGDGGLLEALRATLDVRDATEFATVSVVLDTDWQETEADRFATFIDMTQAWNEAGVKDGRPGFPLAFPAGPGQINPGSPSVGVYLFPGNGAQGALEDILLSCAEHHYPFLHHQAQALLDATHAAYPPGGGVDPFKRSRKVSGSAKARCGIIANALRPGSSLAVSIRDAGWLPLNENAVPVVTSAANFLDCLLAQ